MKLIVAILLITSSVVFAQTANEIQTDFTSTFNFFLGKAQEFATKMSGLLEERVNQYIATHQKLIDNFKSIQTIQNVTLDANSQSVLNNIVTKIENLITGYRTVLSKDIFSKELNKYTTLLQTQYLNKAQTLIDELMSYVTKFPVIGKCWSDNKDQLVKIVEDGFIQARNAAVSAVQGANITLNINELLVNGAIAGNEMFLNICKSNQNTMNGCISTFLAVSEITLPAGSGFWQLSTNMTVSTNLGITELQIATATSSAVANVEQIVRKIETCVTNALVQG